MSSFSVPPRVVENSNNLEFVGGTKRQEVDLTVRHSTAQVAFNLRLEGNRLVRIM